MLPQCKLFSFRFYFQWRDPHMMRLTCSLWFAWLKVSCFSSSSDEQTSLVRPFSHFSCSVVSIWGCLNWKTFWGCFAEFLWLHLFNISFFFLTFISYNKRTCRMFEVSTTISEKMETSNHSKCVLMLNQRLQWRFSWNISATDVSAVKCFRDLSVARLSSH